MHDDRAGERADAIPEALIDALWNEMSHALADARTRATPQDRHVETYWRERLREAALPFLRAAQPEAGNEEATVALAEVLAFLRRPGGNPGLHPFHIAADAIEREFSRAAHSEADRAPEDKR